MVTEVCIGVPVALSSMAFDAILLANATVPALRLFASHRSHCIFTLDSRNSVILLALRGLTVPRFNFKVELEAATED